MSTLNNNSRIFLQPMKLFRQNLQIRVLGPSLITPLPKKKRRLEVENESSSPCFIQCITAEPSSCPVRSSSTVHLKSSGETTNPSRPRTKADVRRERPAVKHIMPKRKNVRQESSGPARVMNASFPVPRKKSSEPQTEMKRAATQPPQTGAKNTKNEDSRVEKSQILAWLENEFTCCVCDDLMIEPVLTRCNHMFCAYCLKECKKKKLLCPVCRTPRMTERPIKSLGEYITKMVQELSPTDLHVERLKSIEQRNKDESPTRRSRSSSRMSVN